jgi:hypothetical protein
MRARSTKTVSRRNYKPKAGSNYIYQKSVTTFNSLKCYTLQCLSILPHPIVVGEGDYQKPGRWNNLLSSGTINVSPASRTPVKEVKAQRQKMIQNDRFGAGLGKHFRLFEVVAVVAADLSE